jgi:tetratricopeptide (TPR) repeat protein
MSGRSALSSIPLGALLVALAGGCSSGDKTVSTSSPGQLTGEAPDTHELRSVSLPDLSRSAESVRQQLRERYSLLIKEAEDPAATSLERGNAYGELGKLFMAADYLDVAESCFVNAGRLMPADARWPYYLGHVHRNRGDLAQSATFFEQSLRLRPSDATTLVWLGNVYLDQGQPDRAEALFTRALSPQSHAVAALIGLGRGALVRKDYARAVTYLEQALARDQRASGVHYPLAMAYRGLGDLAKAEVHLRQRGDVHIGPPDPLMEELGGLLESAMAYQSRGIRALEQGQWTAAADYFRKGIELEPDAPALRHRLGTALFMIGDARGASEQFKHALRLSPQFARAHYSLGVLFASSGRYENAIERFAAAVTYEPDYGEARLALADTLRGIGRSQEALRHYEQLLEIDPRVADARFGYAMTLVSLERYQYARDSLTDSMRMHPDRQDFAHALARLLAAAPNDRVRDGRRAMEIMRVFPTSPGSSDLSETMAMTLAELGKYEEAAAWQRDAIAVAHRSGRSDLAKRMAGNLRLYEAHNPCRTPWRDGELP